MEPWLLETILGPLITVLREDLLGPNKAVYCYVTENGRVPSREFLDSLPARSNAFYFRTLRKDCEGHRLRGYTKHPLGDPCKGTQEYKDLSGATRLIHVDDDDIIILLFGYKGKKSDKMPKSEQDKAAKYRDSYRRRLKEASQHLSRRH